MLIEGFHIVLSIDEYTESDDIIEHGHYETSSAMREALTDQLKTKNAEEIWVAALLIEPDEDPEEMLSIPACEEDLLNRIDEMIIEEIGDQEIPDVFPAIKIRKKGIKSNAFSLGAIAGQYTYNPNNAYIVCPWCFNIIDNCDCYKWPEETYVIDKKIYPVIAELNRRGYKTTSSCEMHSVNGSAYIGFEVKYFDDTPQGWKLTYSHSINHHIAPQLQNDIDLEEYKNKLYEDLLNWAKSLPALSVFENE